MNPDDLPTLLNIDEARAILRVGRASLYEAIREGKIPHIKIGKQIRIPKKRLLEWLEDPFKHSVEK